MSMINDLLYKVFFFSKKSNSIQIINFFVYSNKFLVKSVLLIIFFLVILTNPKPPCYPVLAVPCGIYGGYNIIQLFLDKSNA